MLVPLFLKKIYHIPCLAYFPLLILYKIKIYCHRSKKILIFTEICFMYITKQRKVSVKIHFHDTANVDFSNRYMFSRNWCSSNEMLLHCLLTKQKILFAIFSINNFIQPFNAMFKILRYSYNVHWHVWCIHVSLPALTDYFIFFPTTSSSAAASSLLFSWMTDATFCPVVYVQYTGNYACLGRCILHSTLAILWLFFLVFSVVGFVASLLWLSFEFSQKKNLLAPTFLLFVLWDFFLLFTRLLSVPLGIFCFL